MPTDGGRGAPGADRARRGRSEVKGRTRAPVSDGRGRAERAALAAEAKKAQDIAILEVRDLTPIADYFVVCSGRSALQVQAIADAVVEALERDGQRLLHAEGYEAARWVLLDFGDVVVHVFHDEERRYYDIERLWRDAPRWELPQPALEP